MRIIYDRAELEFDRDINDENTWNIIEDREAERAKIEAKDFGKDQIFRYLEERKKATEVQFTDPLQAPAAADTQ